MPSTSPIRRVTRLLLRSNLVVAGGVVALTAYCAGAMGVAAGIALAVTGAGTLLIYNLDHLRDDRRRLADGGRPRLARGGRLALLTLATGGLVAGLALAPPAVFVASLPSGAAGLLYGAAFGGLRLKDVPGAKAWLVAAAVSWAVVTLPLSAAGQDLATAPWDLAAFVLALTALNAHAFDLRDVAVDSAAGGWTWAVVLGEERARTRMVGAAIGLAAVFTVLAGSTGRWEQPACLLATAGALLISRGASRERFGLLFDGLLAAPLAWTWLS